MSVTDKTSWNKLGQHAQEIGDWHLAQFFEKETKRFDACHLHQDGLLLDYSKQRVNSTTVDLLCNLARECELSNWIEKLFSGAPINQSENRPALHTALRLPSDSQFILDGSDIVPDIQYNLERMENTVNRVHARQWRGFSGLPVDTIVNIGVGGSDLGPYMARRVEAQELSRSNMNIRSAAVS
ncbi:MAG: hypothetical protein AAF353_11050 [Pseudomonadota bacterium]